LLKVEGESQLKGQIVESNENGDIHGRDGG